LETHRFAYIKPRFWPPELLLLLPLLLLLLLQLLLGSLFRSN